MSAEKQKLLHLEDELFSVLSDKKQGIVAVSQAVRRARAGLAERDRPNGSFMFLVRTGVGKTELCKALAEVLRQRGCAAAHRYVGIHAGDRSRLIERPGYVGYEEGGYLTEAWPSTLFIDLA